MSWLAVLGLMALGALALSAVAFFAALALVLGAAVGEAEAMGGLLKGGQPRPTKEELGL